MSIYVKAKVFDISQGQEAYVANQAFSKKAKPATGELSQFDLS